MHAITLPTRLLWGRYDELLPLGLAREVMDSLGSADKSLVLFEGSGHQPFLNEPEKYAKTVLDFVRTH